MKYKHFNIINKLHTDILEEKYGPIHAVVLRHDDFKKTKKKIDLIRKARLVDEKDILRTYALTFLVYDITNQEITNIDDEIRHGGLIGQTFRKHGYTIKKNVIDVFIVVIPAWMKKDFQTDSNKAKARLTEFYTKKENSVPTIYGIVLEIYSPDFRNPEDGINKIDIAQVNPLICNLRDAGISVDEIWKRLDRANETSEWEDLKHKYKIAQELSQPSLQTLHQKIFQYLKAENH